MSKSCLCKRKNYIPLLPRIIQFTCFSQEEEKPLTYQHLGRLHKQLPFYGIHWNRYLKNKNCDVDDITGSEYFFQGNDGLCSPCFAVRASEKLYHKYCLKHLKILSFGPTCCLNMLWSCDTGKSFQTLNSLSRIKDSFYLPQHFD